MAGLSDDVRTPVDDPVRTPASFSRATGDQPVVGADALQGFSAGTRRANRRYALVLMVVTAVVVAAFLIVVARGEISHVHSRVATSAAPNPAVVTPSSPLTVAWQSSDATAIGIPFAGGTVVTYSAHTVSGRDARTGQVRWSFTRSDRVLCTVVQEASKTVALYSAKGNCDQVTTLDTNTGARIRERTLDDDGHLVKGTPTVLTSPDTVLIATESQVRALRLSDGLNSWVYVAPTGCRNLREVRGSAGVLISQHCADGDHLLLRDLYAGDKSDSNKTDPVKWRVSTGGVVPVSADSFIAALDPGTRKLLRYTPGTGAVMGTATTLTPTPSPLRPVLQTPSTSGELIWVGDTVYSLNSTGTSQQWSTAALTLPVFSGPTTGTGATDLSTLAVPTTSGISVLAPATGDETQTYSVTPPAPTSRIFRLGSGFLVADASTTVYQ